MNRLPPTGGEGDSPLAPWGVSGTLVGLGATFLLLVTEATVLAALISVLQLDAENPPVALRYTQIAVFQFALVAVPFTFLWFLSLRPSALGLRPLSRRAAIESVAAGALLSAGTWLYAFALERFWPAAYEGLLSEHQDQQRFVDGPLVLLLPMVLILAPLAEEIFFRGFLFGGLRRQAGFAVASGVSAALFALIHLMKWSTPPLFLIGLVAASVFERHRSLWAAVVLHASFNATELLTAVLFGG